MTNLTPKQKRDLLHYRLTGQWPKPKLKKKAPRLLGARRPLWRPR